MTDRFESPQGDGSYRELTVWQRGIELAKNIYQLTDHFPSSEAYGLVSQLRRASVSVPSNIAEGQARRTSGEFTRFLQIALGSLAEIDTQLVLSREFGYINMSEFKSAENLIFDLRRMLYGLLRSLSKN